MNDYYSDDRSGFLSGIQKQYVKVHDSNDRDVDANDGDHGNNSSYKCVKSYVTYGIQFTTEIQLHHIINLNDEITIGGIWQCMGLN